VRSTGVHRAGCGSSCGGSAGDAKVREGAEDGRSGAGVWAKDTVISG